MFKKLLPLILIALCPAAHAWDCTYWHQWTNPSGECYIPPPTSGSTASASSSSSQQQQQQQQQSQSAKGGDSSSTSTSQGGSASNAGNTQTSVDSYSYPRQTPPALSGYVEPTIPCAAARNGGASSPIAGISFGFSTHDKDCDLREDARMLYEFGQVKLAVELICLDAIKRGLKHCDFQPAAPPDYVTQKQLLEIEKRIIEKSTQK